MEHHICVIVFVVARLMCAMHWMRFDVAVGSTVIIWPCDTKFTFKLVCLFQYHKREKKTFFLANKFSDLFALPFMNFASQQTVFSCLSLSHTHNAVAYFVIILYFCRPNLNSFSFLCLFVFFLLKRIFVVTLLL